MHPVGHVGGLVEVSRKHAGMSPGLSANVGVHPSSHAPLALSEHAVVPEVQPVGHAAELSVLESRSQVGV